MPDTTRLHRFNNYPYKLHEEVELERYIESESGETYLLTVLNELGDFKLEIPSKEGKHDTIYDSFNEFQHREALYRNLDKGIYEFIQDTMKDVEGLYVKEKPEGTEIKVTMNNDQYVLTVVQSTGFCKLKYPERVVEFYIDNIFIENPELPLLKEGRLVQHLVEQVKKKLGLNLPKVPYLPMLKVEQEKKF